MTGSEYNRISDILRGIKSGMRDSFADLYAMYEKDVFFIASKELDSKTAAETAAADIFGYIYTHIQSFNNPAAFDKWVYSVAVTRSEARMTSIDRELHESELLIVPGIGDNIEQLIAGDKAEAAKYPGGVNVDVTLMQIVDSVISDLPLRLRSVMMLYYLGGLDIDSIASVERVTPAQVRDMLAKLRTTLITEEHKYSEMNYGVNGFVLCLPQVLSTMAKSIVVPENVSRRVAQRTGINLVSSDEYYDSDETRRISITTSDVDNPYATGRIDDGRQGMSGGMKAIIVLVALLVVAAAGMIIFFAVRSGNPGKQGEINTGAPETTTLVTVVVTTREPETEPTAVTTTEMTTSEVTLVPQPTEPTTIPVVTIVPPATAAPETTTSAPAPTEAPETNAPAPETTAAPEDDLEPGEDPDIDS
ncbi:MAG: hypothetical protein K6G90_11980 [Clostridia bacterium]|nr:hypothetical protein [Clostridia bacterium]